MRKSISMIRIAVLFALITVGTVLIFGEEYDEDIIAFIIHFLFDKTIAVLALLTACKLYARWRKVDMWIMAVEKYINLEEE